MRSPRVFVNILQRQQEVRELCRNLKQGVENRAGRYRYASKTFFFDHLLRVAHAKPEDIRVPFRLRALRYNCGYLPRSLTPAASI
jgi:hypothetical protein